MFRKVKKKQTGLRRPRPVEDDDDDDEPNTADLLQQAKQEHNNNNNNKRFKTTLQEAEKDSSKILHSFQADKNGNNNKASDLVTSTVQHHPEELMTSGSNQKKSTKSNNKLLAGPIRAAANIRTTCRFDYQPDICKDYKETGFCGFGDTCIYLHDRGDTLSGWQLEEKWQQEQAQQKALQEQQMKDFADGKTNKDETEDEEDGLPFACFLCRSAFTDPVVTLCGHYFCEKCLHQHVKESETSKCPICQKDTHSVWNEAAKLIAKKRKVIGSSRATWQEFYNHYQDRQPGEDDDKP